MRAHSASTSTSITPAIRSLDSYNAKTVAAALDTDAKGIDDAWQAICVRVLPLFNGEGVRGYIEDVNDLVLSVVIPYESCNHLMRCST